jgi:2-methylfumaryl-CoA isomerase
MHGLISNMRVVEGASFIAAPSCGLYLAQMGAEVIRFDQIGGGPDFNRWPLAPTGASFYWEGLNKGKKSIALDLAAPRGRELAVALACGPGKSAGLFVTNYPCNGFLSYEALRQHRPDLICVRVMGWPDGSPALDYTVNAATGLPLMTGPIDIEGPVNHVLPAWDLLCGSYSAFALLAAERQRQGTHRGCEVRVALSDIAASSLSHLGYVAEVYTGGVDRPRIGNDLYGAFGRDFRLKSGQRVMICAITRRQWRALVGTLGLSAAISDVESRLGVSFDQDEALRFRHRDTLYPLFERALIDRTLEELAPALEAGGVTWAPYQSLHTAVTTDDRLFASNPIFQSIEHPSGLVYPASGPAAVLPAQGPSTVRPAPRLGEHTDEVLASVLGLSAGAIGALHDAGVVAGASVAQ